MKISAWGLLAAFLVRTHLCSCTEAPNRSGIAWSQLQPLPDSRGVAAPFSGVSNGALLVAGGANFPEKMPWEGDTKVWHDGVYALESPSGSWELVGRLPGPLAYGVSAVTNGGLLCIGGSDAEVSLELRRAAHKALAAVTDDLSSLRFNRAIARIYELANALGVALAGGRADAASVKEAAEFLVLMSAPMMPHLAEECWQAMSKPGYVVDTAWPKADPVLLADDQVTIAVQVNGKRRGEITVAKDLDAKSVEALALELGSVVRALDGRPVKKVIVVPGRIANIVG